MTVLFHSNQQTLLLKEEVTEIAETVPEPKDPIEAARLRKEFEFTRDGRMLADQQKNNFFAKLEKTCSWLRGRRTEG